MWQSESGIGKPYAFFKLLFFIRQLRGSFLGHLFCSCSTATAATVPPKRFAIRRIVPPFQTVPPHIVSAPAQNGFSVVVVIAVSSLRSVAPGIVAPGGAAAVALARGSRLAGIGNHQLPGVAARHLVTAADSAAQQQQVNQRFGCLRQKVKSNRINCWRGAGREF